MKSLGHKSALIINHNGIGNGIMVLPIFGALGREWNDLHYFHTYNEAMNSSYLRGLAGVKNLEGFVPAIWRRFAPQDWEDILGFMRKMNMSLLINLRLQSPALDRHYFEFKNMVFEFGIECWDLYECGSEIFNRPIGSSIVDLFFRHGVNLEPINWSWLHALSRGEADQEGYRVAAVFLGGSQPIKRWFGNSWSLLIRGLLSGIGYSLWILPGRTPEEQEYAWAIFQEVHEEWPHRTLWVSKLSLEEFVLTLSRSHLVITHDTFASHLSASLGIPAFVLFLATNGHIWRPIPNHYFRCLQSNISLNCDQMKVDGTCIRFYGSCHQSCSEGVEPETACKEIIGYLRRSTMSRTIPSDYRFSYK